MGKLPVHIFSLIFALSAFFLFNSDTAQANRFGFPWQGMVIADNVTTFAEPKEGARPIGPLGKGAKVPVIGQSGDYFLTSVGYLPKAVVDIYTEPWIAEITADSASVFAKATAGSGIRRTSVKGDLFRVTGVAPGLDGDRGLYWATTEGFIRVGDLAESQSDFANGWKMPDAKEALSGTWGRMTDNGRVRAAPSTKAPIVGNLAAGQNVKVLSEAQGEPVDSNPTWYRIDGGRYAGAFVHSSLIRKSEPLAPVALSPQQYGVLGTFIVVDRGRSVLTLYKDSKPAFSTLVSLGRASVETPNGRYSTFGKFEYDDMRSLTVPDATGSYHLPNVPYTQYYKSGGYAIHGTYWHDGFGGRESQGCINLTVTDGAYLFGETVPAVPEGADQIWAEGEATPVIIIG